ncbi:phage major capsid protein [Nocardioides sp. BP30]|uniref:phage major capsid protein n=1 Tax=Nocardioides sp. BP30 TaxID=3036374 RepID=UPI002469A358|nr:phage major capsid protein [Nocardioides sp. BP30]WGL50646.1 phage major capsid protein [Nocardioides sp. BP30]
MPEALTLDGEAIPQRLDIDIVRSRDVRTELRAAEPAEDGTDPQDAGPGTLVGEFSLFNEWYEINSYWEGHFIERLAPGAFKRTITNRTDQSPVRVILEHGFDPTVADKPLGVPSVLEERSSGVYAETPLFDTSYNRDLAPALAGGAYGQSFRFQPLRDEFIEPDSDGWEDTGNPAWAALPQRTITEVRLIEFGPTIWPASPATNGVTGLRSTTDQFYEQLARRDTVAYEAAIRSVRGSRAPAPRAPEPEGTSQRTTEDPHAGHSKATPAPAEQAARSKAADPPPVKHSTATTPNPSRKDTVMANMTIEERAARMTDIDARLTEINTEHRGGALPDDVQAEWDTLATERAGHVEATEAQTKREEYLRSIADNPSAGESHDAPAARSAAFGAPNVRKVVDPYDLNAMRTKARSLDELHGLMHENAMRAVESARFPGVEDRSAAQATVVDLLQRVDAPDVLAQRILSTGSPAYERAFGKAISKKPLSAEEQRALSLGSDEDGGYAVPFQLDPTVILTNDGVTNPLRGLARVVQITGKKWEGLTSAGITVTRKGETDEANDDSPSFDQPVVDTSRVDGFVPFSVALEQSWAALRDELTMMLADAKATEEATSFVTGAGTAVTGGGTLPQGVLTGATNLVQTGSATALARTDLFAVKNALPHRFRNNAQWLAEDSFYDAVRGLDEDGDIWAALADDKGQRLLGKPVNEASAIPAFALTAGKKVAVYGDFQRGFIIVDRIGMSVELVPQVFGANGRPTGQRGIFAWWFNGSKVLVPQALRTLQIKAS